MTTAFHNVDGLSELVDVSSFVSSKSPDLFFLLETKRRAEEVASDISIPGYDLTEIRRSDVSVDRAGVVLLSIPRIMVACFLRDTHLIFFMVTLSMWRRSVSG